MNIYCETGLLFTRIVLGYVDCLFSSLTHCPLEDVHVIFITSDFLKLILRTEIFYTSSETGLVSASDDKLTLVMAWCR